MLVNVFTSVNRREKLAPVVSVQDTEARGEIREHRQSDASPASGPDVLRAGFMQGIKTDPRTTYGDLQALASWSVEDRLGALSVATLVVRGADETEALAASGDSLSQALNGEPARVVPDAGHMLPLEQPEGLAREVVEFVGRLP